MDMFINAVNRSEEYRYRDWREWMREQVEAQDAEEKRCQS